MATLKDIARHIATGNDFKGGGAESFVTAIVDTILEGLAKDRQVKIKGFGTFKLTAVKERESVNVNTGERVTITGHDKITFSPEASVRDLINKPFAQFDTVVLSDLVDLEAMADVGTEEDDIDENTEKNSTATIVPLTLKTAMPPKDVELQVTPQEHKKQEVQEVQEEKEVQEEQEVHEDIAEPEEECTSTIEPQPQDETEMTTDNEQIEIETEYDDEGTGKKKLLIYAVIINIITVALAFAGGYYLGTKHYFCHDDAAPAVEQTAAPVKPTPAAPHKATADSITSKADTTVAQQSATPQPDETPKAEETTNDAAKYYTDARIRTGAYDIIGVAQTVTVQSGQTLKSISKAYLGPDMECYVEALNGVKEVQAGDKLQIPKLKIRKKKKN